MLTQSLEWIASYNVCLKMNHADLLTSEKLRLLEEKEIVSYSKLLIQKNRQGV
ncbi:Hypothetical predicted protein [Paramuricea clavata]|uniref:Uncharacterized protein n=1 Tax=Paramuricea clavata TaxID=317549 RepID=A0A6S7GC55_PARCT|nr:Hypothetical predicted protein [Paramuricea clavata]